LAEQTQRRRERQRAEAVAMPLHTAFSANRCKRATSPWRMVTCSIRPFEGAASRPGGALQRRPSREQELQSLPAQDHDCGGDPFSLVLGGVEGGLDSGVSLAAKNASSSPKVRSGVAPSRAALVSLGRGACRAGLRGRGGG